jgi:DNA-binding response OmpR family regulator
MTEPARVLVVEDDRYIRQLVVDTLTDEGYEVRAAESGEAGLEVLGAWVPDLILLDVTLPTMDGPSFRAEQRRLPAPASAVPVVLVTGAYKHEHLVKDLEAYALLRKPFDLDRLVDLVGEATGHHV